jgi:hypothetical protein
MGATFLWMNATELEPPHMVVRPNQVLELVEDFQTKGWDTSKPPLRAYPFQGKIQLLSGTHRRAAAELAAIKVPVVVWDTWEVEKAWGTSDWDRIMGIGLHNSWEGA